MWFKQETRFSSKFLSCVRERKKFLRKKCNKNEINVNETHRTSNTLGTEKNSQGHCWGRSAAGMVQTKHLCSLHPNHPFWPLQIRHDLE